MEIITYSELIDAGLYSSEITLVHKLDKTQSKYNYTQRFYDYGDKKWSLRLRFRLFADSTSLERTAIDRFIQSGMSNRWVIPIGEFVNSKFIQDVNLGQIITAENGVTILKGVVPQVTNPPSGEFNPIMYSWVNKLYMIYPTTEGYSISPILWVDPFRFPGSLPQTGSNLTFTGRLSSNARWSTAIDGWITCDIKFMEDGSPV